MVPNLQSATSKLQSATNLSINIIKSAFHRVKIIKNRVQHSRSFCELIVLTFDDLRRIKRKPNFLLRISPTILRAHLAFFPRNLALWLSPIGCCSGVHVLLASDDSTPWNTHADLAGIEDYSTIESIPPVEYSATSWSPYTKIRFICNFYTILFSLNSR